MQVTFVQLMNGKFNMAYFIQRINKTTAISYRLQILLLVVCLILINPEEAQSQDTSNVSDTQRFLLTEASYIGDATANFRGGVTAGTAYMGMANLMIDFDLDKAGILKGSKLFLKGANIHGTSLSSMTGDIQVASNIDAGNHTYLQEFWISKTCGEFELTLGLQDLNAQFAVSEYGGLFVNSSFGILPTISANTTAPIFPLTTIGLTAKWTINRNFTWLVTIHDGKPHDFALNPYNLKWGFHKEDGLLTVTEIQFANNNETYRATYKLGLFSEYKLNTGTDEGTIIDTIRANHRGIYFYADQRIFERAHRTLSIFGQTGYSPGRSAISPFYAGLGVHLQGAFSKTGKDVFGLAAGNIQLNGGLKSETAIELTYQYTVNNFFFIQPDIQYIINPAGTGYDLPNSVAGILRFGLLF